MVALKIERRVFMWRLRPRVAPVEAAEAGKIATLDEIVCILEGEYTANRARVYLSTESRLLEDDDPTRDDKNQIYVANITRDPKRDCIVFLVNRGDPNAVSPAFITPSSNAVRVEHPKATEAPGWSAHLLISTKSSSAGHRCCFEQMPHVSSRIVLSAIDKIVARALAANPTYKFEVIKTEKGKAKVTHKPYRPTLDANRVPSERLIDDLDVGSLTGVTLTKKSTFWSGVGIEPTVKRQEEKIVITLAPSEKKKVTDFLTGLLEKAKSQHYESITFNVDDLPGKQTSSPTLPLDDQDAMEHLYVRAKRLTGFANFLAQCYSSPYKEIVDKMAETLNDDKEW